MGWNRIRIGWDLIEWDSMGWGTMRAMVWDGTRMDGMGLDATMGNNGMG